jgi:hypothetical protein
MCRACSYSLGARDGSKSTSKWTSEIASEMLGTRTPFSKGGIEQTVIRIPNLKNRSNRARSERKDRQAAYPRVNDQPEKGGQNEGKKSHPKRRQKNLPKIAGELPQYYIFLKFHEFRKLLYASAASSTFPQNHEYCTVPRVGKSLARVQV